MTNKTLELAFLTAENKTVRLALANPLEPVDPAKVQAAMDLIIQKNIFATPSGDLVKKAEARLTEISRNTVV